MALRRKSDTGNGEMFKFENVGDSLEGVYLGSFEHDGEYGPTQKHQFKTDAGIKVVFGQKHLCQLLEGEKQGVKMIATYVGNKKTRKGKPMKEYTLDIDDEYQASEEELLDMQNAGEKDDPTDVPEETRPADEVTTAPAKSKVTGQSPSTATVNRARSLLNKTRVA